MYTLCYFSLKFSVSSAKISLQYRLVITRSIVSLIIEPDIQITQKGSSLVEMYNHGIVNRKVRYFRY